MAFLEHRDGRPLTMQAPQGFTPRELHLGSGAMGLEVAVLDATRKPTSAELRELHAARLGKRATPVVVVVVWANERTAVAGPKGDELAVVADIERSQVERVCDAALAAPDRHAALRILRNALDHLDAPIPGLRNSGLFALHELEAGVPRRPDWQEATRKAKPIITRRGRQIIEGLGYAIEVLPGLESILVANGTKVAIALFLERPDEIEPANPQFGGLSPVSHALARADQENLDYVVILAGSTLRVYPVKTGIGTGRRGRTETFAELNLDLLSPQQAGYLWLLFSADALAAGGTFASILERSADYAAELGTRLRERVYKEVVPNLAMAIVRARRLRGPSAEQLRETYQMALLVLFRLLFVAYAEDNERLPLHQNEIYGKHSLKEMAKQLAETLARGTSFERQDFYWNEVNQLWKAVEKGNRAWGVPVYNGGLFAWDEGLGARLAALALPDETFAPALAALLLDETEEGTKGPIDFRPLGVREFGTIYEGLLESELSVAETDLAVDPRTDAYIPVKGRATFVVREGDVYLHNASGARKSTGAYYTKSFAVEHLLDRALEPALDGHLARLDAMYDAREAADHFFDFRVADIAMGSGHFLVAAVDRIERRLSNYLAKRPLAGVADELERLRKTALDSLGPEWTGDSIEDTQLLRRQIARRCVFGVDLNYLAVELARLSIWIHTFVPGLPLSFLDANLVVGNSLVGVATFGEAQEILGAGLSLFEISAEEMLSAARPLVARLAKLADATAAEVKQAKKLYVEMIGKVSHVAGLFDVVTAARIDNSIREKIDSALVTKLSTEQGDAFTDSLVRRASKALSKLVPLHFPIAFPQVFLSTRAGFDVILGNPPWEKAHVEEHEFWGRHYPGFRGLKQAQREAQLPRMKKARPDLVAAFEAERTKADALRAILLAGPFPGMGSGHPDLYKAFCWRFWQLVSRDGGSIGVVLPRAVFAAKGSEEFRRALLDDTGATDLTTLVNNRGWVFEEVHPQFSIGLVAIQRGNASPSRELRLRGPYASLGSYVAKRVAEPARFRYEVVRGWTESLTVPLLPSEGSAEVFVQMRKSPRFDSAGGNAWAARPLQGDLNATAGRPMMDFKATPSKSMWPVCAGESFDLWTPETGRIYAVADAHDVCAHLQEKRLSSARIKRSAWAEFPARVLKDASTLPCRHPRIAFRDVSRATDSRTVRVALLPPNRFLVHNAPFLLFPAGDVTDEAFLLGVMSSLPFDWYARRFVETHLTFDVLSDLPVPACSRDAPLRRRAVDCAGRLAAQDDRFIEWARALGLKPRGLRDDERKDLIAELDAAIAHLFGLTEGNVSHIFETFHEGWDYGDRLDSTLKHYRDLKSLA